MLQRSVWTQLARLKSPFNIVSIRGILDANYLPPMRVTLNQVKATIERMDKNAKHWFVGGDRCLGVGVKLLQDGEIIAVPTDTVYGLTTLAQNSKCVEKLYELKERDRDKPIAICVSSIKDIKKWAEIDHLPEGLLVDLLPGPITVVLKRKTTLNPALNPGKDTIGIRVTDSKFIRSICKIIDQPLALTSANSSNQPSSLMSEEFKHLWPQLGGIFYTIVDKKKLDESFRVGSTVVDLSVPGEFSIIRMGVGHKRAIRLCNKHGVRRAKSVDDNNVEDDGEKNDKE